MLYITHSFKQHFLITSIKTSFHYILIHFLFSKKHIPPQVYIFIIQNFR